MRELAQCRKEIDEIDRQLAALFEQRMAVCREVGAYKREHGFQCWMPAGNGSFWRTRPPWPAIRNWRRC